MIKNKKILAGAGLLTLTALIGGTSVASAQFDQKPPRLDEDTREALHDAVEAGDYNAWKNLLPEDHPKLESITEENFDRLQDLHEAKQNGDREEVKAIAQELGLKFKKKRQHRRGGGDPETREARRAAVEAGDYDEWRSLTGERFNDRFTEAQAQDIFRMHQLRLDGDKEGAKAIAEELGLKKRGKRGGAFHQTNNDGNQPQA